MSHMLQFAGHDFVAVGRTALFWPSQNTLLVSDLHLEKASSYAVGSGQMLPPYDSAATLQMLAGYAAQSGATSVICLGDNFHDDAGVARLSGEAAGRLFQLTQRYDWHWITGNHDPGIDDQWGGSVHQEMCIGGIMLRHNIDSADPRPEISGHYHPKLRMKLRGKIVSRPCFLQMDNRLVMPSFGVLTGGMDVRDVCALYPSTQNALSYVATDSRLLVFPAATGSSGQFLQYSA